VSTAQIVDYSIGITASVLVTVLALVYSRRALLKIQVCSFLAISSFECAACCGLSTLSCGSSAPVQHTHADMYQAARPPCIGKCRLERRLMTLRRQ